MADEQSKQSAKSKRRVKNPETFRERAMKAGEASAKPQKAARAKKAGGRASTTIAKPFKRLGRLRIVKLAGKVLLPTYIRNSWRELKLVTWPNWKQSRQLTFAVIIFAVVFGAVIAIVDYGLDKVFRSILLK